MSILRDLAEGALYLSLIALGAGLLYALGRDRTAANEHDLWAHHDEPTAEPALPRHIPDPVIVERTREYLPRIKERTRRIRPAAALTGPVGWAAWEPEPARWGGPTPPIARAVLIEHAVPTLSDAAVRGIACEWLHEIGEAAQAKAGIRTAMSPATDRDITGAFAVVAVA